MNNTTFGFNCEATCLQTGSGAIGAAIKAGAKLFSIHNVFDKHYYDPATETLTREQRAARFAQKVWQYIWMNQSVNQPDPLNNNKPFGHPGIILNIAYAPYFMMTPEQKAAIPSKYTDSGNYSNRWHPANAEEYQYELQELLIQLKKKDESMFEAIEYDLGQEPNAKRYWWGKFGEWADFSELKRTILIVYDRKFYGYHNASSLLIDNDYNSGIKYFVYADMLSNFSTSFYEVNSAGTFDYLNNQFPTKTFASILWPEVNRKANLKDRTGLLLKDYHSQSQMAFYIRFLKWSHQIVQDRTIDKQHRVIWYTLYDCSTENNKGLFGYWVHGSGTFIKTTAWDHIVALLRVARNGWAATEDGIVGMKERIRIKPDGLTYQVTGL